MGIIEHLEYGICHRLIQNKVRDIFQGVPQSQITALPRHQEEEETDKSKQAQFKQIYEKH